MPQCPHRPGRAGAGMDHIRRWRFLRWQLIAKPAFASDPARACFPSRPPHSYSKARMNHADVSTPPRARLHINGSGAPLPKGVRKAAMLLSARSTAVHVRPWANPLPPFFGAAHFFGPALLAAASCFCPRKLETAYLRPARLAGQRRPRSGRLVDTGYSSEDLGV